MTLRWELAPEQPDRHTYWYLLDGDDALALLSVQHGLGQLRGDFAAFGDRWLPMRVHPDGESSMIIGDSALLPEVDTEHWRTSGWFIGSAMLEPMPDVDDWRLSGLQLPPLVDGPLSLTFPPLPAAA